MVGGAFFYSEGGAQVAHGQLWIPYAGVGVVVLLLAVVFYFAPMPDFSFTDYDMGDGEGGGAPKTLHRPAVIFAFMLLNVAALGLSLYLVLNAILPFCGVGPDGIRHVTYGIVAAVALSAPLLFSGARRVGAQSIWAHPHFSGATLAQFFYVAAQAGIFSFFINYVISEMPAISASVADWWPLSGRATLRDGALFVNEQGASRLQGFVGFLLFTIGRFVGAAILKRAAPHRVLGVYALINVALCGIVAMKLGWISVAAVFLSFYFMSIMFPTIFALGIHGLGAQSKKKASAFIVMSITGGALMPKVMGHLGDVYNMSIAYLMPLACFAFIAAYGFGWAKLSKSDGAATVASVKGH